MKDISLLLVRPEGFSRRDEIVSWLVNHEYTILERRTLQNWYELLPEVYGQDASWKGAPPELLQEFLGEYKKRSLGTCVEAVIIAHQAGNTIDRLTKDVGPWRQYSPETLRHEFGLPQDSSTRWVFCALHRVDNEQMLKQHIALLFGQERLREYDEDP